MRSALAALAALTAAAVALAAAPALAQEGWDAAPAWDEDDEEERDRLSVTAWGGEALDDGGAGRSYGVLGGEVGWAFGALDVGVAGYGYRGLPGARTWTPVAMLRLTQRFPMRGGVEGTFGIGGGAGRPQGAWEGWFQVALGARVPLGPIFLRGELAFERSELLRLAAGIGASF